MVTTRYSKWGSQKNCWDEWYDLYWKQVHKNRVWKVFLRDVTKISNNT